MQVVSTIYLYLADDVIIHVLSKIFLIVIWMKIEKMYMMKLFIHALSLEVVLLAMDEQEIMYKSILATFKRSSLISSVFVRRLKRRLGC